MIRKKVGIMLAAVGIVVLLACGTIIMVSWSETDEAQSEKPPNTVLTVSVFSPSMMTWDNSLLATGNILPWQEAMVSTEANGLSIVQLHADIGDSVHKGQLLAELQHDTLSAEIEQVDAELEQAQAQREEAQADAGRARKLSQTSALSHQQITQYLVAEKVARTRVRALQARLKMAHLRLAQTRIIAPDDGVITERLATPGSVVSPGDLLFRLHRQSRLEWRAELPANELSHVRIGQSVTIDLNEGAAITGEVRRIAPTVDPHSRNGIVYVDLVDINSARAGTFAIGHILLGKTHALGVPLTAISFREGFAWVFQVDDEGRVRQRQVSVGQRHDGWVAVYGGITAQDRLITSGVAFLSEGDRVRVVPQASELPSDEPGGQP